jgi:hypothetical protein
VAARSVYFPLCKTQQCCPRSRRRGSAGRVLQEIRLPAALFRSRPISASTGLASARFDRETQEGLGVVTRRANHEVQRPERRAPDRHWLTPKRIQPLTDSRPAARPASRRSPGGPCSRVH